VIIQKQADWSYHSGSRKRIRRTTRKIYSGSHLLASFISWNKSRHHHNKSILKFYLNSFIRLDKLIFNIRLRNDNAGDDASAAQQILNRVRNSVRAVVPCDYFEDDPLMAWSKDKFDVIITSFCLECTSSLEDYSKAMKNIVNLLRPSGHLIIQVYNYFGTLQVNDCDSWNMIIDSK